MILRTSTDNNDDDEDDGAHVGLIFNHHKSATNRVTSFPVGLGSRPPCLGQECSPVRSTPCGAGREAGGGSSAATAGTTSGSGSRRVLPAGGRVRLGRGTAAAAAATDLARRGRRRSLPVRYLGPDEPSPAVVRQSYRKVDTWLRHAHRAAAAAPEVVDNRDVITGRRLTPENQLKRKWDRRAGAESATPKRRVTDSDSCSLPSGTFTDSDDEEDDEVDDTNVKHHQSEAERCRVLPPGVLPVSPPFDSTAQPHTAAMTSPRWKTRSRRTRRCAAAGGERRLSDVSSGALGDRSSSLATSSGGDLTVPCRRPPSTVFRTPTAAVKTTTTSRKISVVGRRRDVLRRVTRRLHRVAAADTQTHIRVQTLAVL